MVLLRDFSRFPFFAVHLCRSGKPSVTARAMNGTSRHQRQANRKNAVSDDPNEFEPTDTAYFFVYVCPVSHFRHGSLFLLAVSFRYGFSLGIFISICLCFRLPPFSRLSVGTHQVVILVLGAKVIPGLDGKARSSLLLSAEISSPSGSISPKNLEFPNPYLFKHPKRKRPMRQKDA